MSTFIALAIKQFEKYKVLGEAALAQLNEDHMNWQPTAESNNIALIVKHMHGNMLSRWTDFLTTDGEKPWRNRDTEFETDEVNTETVYKWWQEGWDCLFATLNSLTEEDLDKVIYIRNEPNTVMDAICRQLTHYSSHVGQIIYVAKMCKGSSWRSLTIPRNQSDAFNSMMFSKKDN